MNPPIARQLNLDETKLPAEIFERLSRRGATLKDYRRRREEAIENFGKPGRDPAELGSVMTTIAGIDHRYSGMGGCYHRSTFFRMTHSADICKTGDNTDGIGYTFTLGCGRTVGI